MVNTIDFITIATTGNATDFGDLTNLRGGGAMSSPTRCVIIGGWVSLHLMKCYINGIC